MTVASERDVAKLDAAQQRALEPADGQRRSEVLIRLTDDQIADAVLGPAGFDDGQRKDDNRQQSRDKADDDPCQRG